LLARLDGTTGLKRLFNDIPAGRIDLVVFYKVDRSAKSLSDFAKMVDIFGAAAFRFSRSHRHSTRHRRWVA